MVEISVPIFSARMQCIRMAAKGSEKQLPRSARDSKRFSLAKAARSENPPVIMDKLSDRLMGSIECELWKVSSGRQDSDSTRR